VINIKIGEKIKEERLKKEWTQEQLGKELSVSRSAVSSWEVGRNYPDLETIVIISDLFGISLDQLLREDIQMTTIITQKTKMNKYYKIALILMSCLFLSYLGFNTYLRSTEKKYHNNLLENHWVHSPDIKPAFNQFELKEDGLSYYTLIMPTGLIGVPLTEHKLTIITRYEPFVTSIRNDEDIEIIIHKDNDPSVDYFAKVKVDTDLNIIKEVTSLSETDRNKTENYLSKNKKEYQKMIEKTLIKIDEIKNKRPS